MPWTDFLLFHHRTRSRAVQNIGGIANVTYLPAGGRAEDTLAFDTGPGNMIIDRLAQRASHGRLTYDRDGRLASRGRVDARLMAELMRHPFLRRRPPKSTGREEFGAAMADRVYRRGLRRGLTPETILATATAFTARTIAEAYRRFLPAMPEEVILCGGGARNPALVRLLHDELAPARVCLMDDLGIRVEAKEAVSFALLAWATVRGRPSNLPRATGADHPAVLGKIIPGAR